MMKQKAFTMFAFLALVVLALNFASAESLMIYNVQAPTSVYNNVSSFNVTFNVAYNGTSETRSVTLSSTSLPSITSTFNDSSLVLNGTKNETQTVTVTISNYASYVGQNVVVNLKASSTVAGLTDDKLFSFNVVNATVPTTTPTTNTTLQNLTRDLCGSDYNASMVTLSIDDNEVDNTDKWEWKPLDNIELEVKLKNLDSDEDYDYDVYFLFYDKDKTTEPTSDIADDMDNLEMTGWSVDSRKSETELFNFQVSGEVDEGDYDLYVKVESDQGCYLEKVDSVNIDKNSRQVVVKDVQATNTVKAGETITFDVKIANIGSEDEDKVKVTAYNSALGLNLYREVDSLDSGNTDTVSFTFTVPATAAEGNYKITFATEYNYDDNDDEYDDTESDDDLVYTVNVFGGIASQPAIGAKLLSDAKVGKELSMELTLTNNGRTNATYEVALENTDWAKDVKTNVTSLIVKPGETKTFQVTMTPKSAGTQQFTVKATYNDGEVKSQSISVAISGNAFESIVATLGVAGTILVSAIIILVLAILVVAMVKLAKPKRQQRVESIAY